MSSLDDIRGRIRKKDRELIEAVAERIALADEAGKVKSRRGLPVVDAGVEEEVVAKAVSHGRRHGLDDGLVESVMRAVISHSRHRQQAARGRKGRVDGFGAASWRLPSPMEMRLAVPMSRKGSQEVRDARDAIGDIISGSDGRLLLVMGPCSVHDPAQALEYAGKVRGLARRVGDRFLVVMRAYMEKSRTGRGWAGFLADPFLDGTGDVQQGITATRELLSKMADMGVPAAVEFVNPLAPVYIGDAVSWAAIGARSSGSQLHRALASSLPMPVGIKNAPDGDINVAVNALASSASGHRFLGIDEHGRASAYRTEGNPRCHLVLRGGTRPNHDARSVGAARRALKGAGLNDRVMVDCSHGNSKKKAENQTKVFRSVLRRIANGDDGILGLMLEGNLAPGCQRLPDDLAGFDASSLRRGVSVTDECLGWKETEELVLEAHDALEEL